MSRVPGRHHPPPGPPGRDRHDRAGLRQGFVLLRILLGLEELEVPPDALGPQAGLLAPAVRARLARSRPCAGRSTACPSCRWRSSWGKRRSPWWPPTRGGPSRTSRACGSPSARPSLSPRTAILRHNRGNLFSPASPNLLEGGKRPAHTLMPVIVRKDGGLRVVGGTMGGCSQPRIHVRVLERVLSGEDRGPAVGAPRWVVGAPGGTGRRSSGSRRLSTTRWATPSTSSPP